MRSVILVLVMICFLTAIPYPVLAGEESFKFWVSQDSWVNQGNPGANYGANTYLSVKDKSQLAESYLRFSDADISLLKGKNITSASLYLYQYLDTYSPGDFINLHRVTSDWKEDEITWDLKPAFAAEQSGLSLYLSQDNELWRKWPVSLDLITSWQTQGNYGLMLENNQNTLKDALSARFYSSESSLLDKRPYLEVMTTTTPEPISSALFLLGSGCFMAGKYKGRRKPGV